MFFISFAELHRRRAQSDRLKSKIRGSSLESRCNELALALANAYARRGETFVSFRSTPAHLSQIHVILWRK